MSGKRPAVVYGASGFSGRLVAEFLREYNVPFIAAGRDGAKIEEVLGGVHQRHGCLLARVGDLPLCPGSRHQQTAGFSAAVGTGSLTFPP